LFDPLTGFAFGGELAQVNVFCDLATLRKRPNVRFSQLLLIEPGPYGGMPDLPQSDEVDRINRPRTTAAGEADVCKYAIVNIHSVTAEDQTIHPEMEREFSLNVPKGFAHDSLPSRHPNADWSPPM
jgi:hypothetical protein